MIPKEVTDAEIAFGGKAMELMPSYEKLQKEDIDLKWKKLFSDWFYNRLAKLEIEQKEGIDKSKALRHIKCVMGSFEPKHEHKELGVAYLMSQFFKDAQMGNQMTLLDQGEGAHRYSFKLHKREIPKGKFVCHSCDVRPCVNPDHLWLGTNSENVQDALAKGVRYGPQKLTPKYVKEIRRIGRSMSARSVAKIYGIHNATVYKILKNEIWVSL